MINKPCSEGLAYWSNEVMVPRIVLGPYGDPCTFFWVGWIVLGPIKPVRCKNQYSTGGLHLKFKFSPPQKCDEWLFYSDKLITVDIRYF